MTSATVTILFTDVVSSTEFLSRVGEERAEVIRRELVELLRTAIGAHGGREVKNLGDGLMVAFDGVIGALGCAVAMQQALHARNEHASDPLSIRIGISSGEADIEDGDYFGVPVVEAARVCAKAGAEQIFATEIVRLLAGSRGGFEFAGLGPLELKGLDTPVVAYEVRWSPIAPAVASVPLPARLQPAEGAVFVGRVPQQALLQDALKHADVAAHQRVVLLSGEAGIGKTTLVSTFAAEVYKGGSIVLYGRCDEDLAVPYQPWVEALTHLVDHAPEDVLREHVDHRDGDLVALVPALTSRLHDVPASRSSDRDTERHLLFGAVVDLLARVSAQTSVVLVLDDLHWADRTTLQLLRHVASASAPLRLLVLGTFRETDISASHPLTEVLAALHREAAVVRVPLEGLDDLELLALMESIAGREMDGAATALRDELREETNGNPFFVTEILRHLVETGTIAASELRATGLPVSVREVVGRRVQRLGEDAGRVLSIAAVIGRDFDLPLLVRVVDLDEDRLLDVLDQATRAFVIGEVPGTVDRYSFVHALIQRTLSDDLSAARRRRLHRRIAEELESLPGARTHRVSELARHWFEAAQAEDAPKAFQYAIAAGDEAQVHLAPDEAVRWFSQALELVDQVDASEVARCDTLIRLGVAQRLAADPAFRETLLDAARLAARLHDTERLVASALANSRGFQSSAGAVDTERIEVLHAALDAVGDVSSQRARLLALLAVESFYAPNVDVNALLEEALALASKGDAASRLFVLRAAQIWFPPHTLQRREDLLQEEAALVADADPARRAWYESELSQVAYQIGDAARIRDHLEHWHVAAEHISDPTVVWAKMFADAMVATLWDDLARAERMVEEALRFGLDASQPDAFPIYAAQLATLRRMQGREAEICDIVAEVAEANPGIPGFRAALADLYAPAGRTEEARAILEDFCATGLDRVRVDIVWGSLMAGLARAASIVEHRDTAAQLAPLIAPFRNQFAYSGCTVDGSFALALAMCDRLLERYDDAELAFRDGLDLSVRLEAPYWIAFTKLEWAKLRIDRGTSATDLIADVLSGAREHGYDGLERRAVALQS